MLKQRLRQYDNQTLNFITDRYTNFIFTTLILNKSSDILAICFGTATIVLEYIAGAEHTPNTKFFHFILYICTKRHCSKHIVHRETDFPHWHIVLVIKRGKHAPHYLIHHYYSPLLFELVLKISQHVTVLVCVWWAKQLGIVEFSIILRLSKVL